MRNILSKLISCKKSNFPNLKSQFHEQFRSESSKSCTKLPSNDASTATSSNETSSKASRTHPQVTLHVPTSRPPSLPRCFCLCFCPCFHLCLLSLFPPLPLACASASTPASIIVFAFRLCFRAPVFAFALRPPALSSPRSRPLFALLRRRSIAKSRRLHPQETLA